MTTAREHLFKPFTVKGETITAEQIAAVLPTLRRDSFRFHQVGGAMVRAGVSWENHDRATDRLLQRARKLGLVVFSRGTWGCSLHGWRTIDASGIEARQRQDPQGLDPKGESPTRQGDAHE